MFTSGPPCLPISSITLIAEAEPSLVAIYLLLLASNMRIAE